MKGIGALFLFAAVTVAQTTTVSVPVSGTLSGSSQGATVSVQMTGTIAVTYPSAPAPPLTCTPFTDPLSAPSGTSLNEANWTQPSVFSLVGGNIVQNVGVAQGNAAYRGGLAILTSCPQSLNPSAQFVIKAIDGITAIQGVLAMSTTGNGYKIGISNAGSNSTISKCLLGMCNSSFASVSCSAPFAVGNTFKASAVILASKSIAISVYRNGVLCGTTIDAASPFTTGYSGFAIYANGSATGDQISQVQVVN